jgi:hypothetical protein
MKQIKQDVKQETDKEVHKVMQEHGLTQAAAAKRVLGQGLVSTRQQVPPSLPPPPSRGRGEKRAATKSAGRNGSSSVELTGVNANKSTDMKFWAEQSGNELRSQITFRQGRRGDWAVKGKQQLLDHIQRMITQGIW